MQRGAARDIHTHLRDLQERNRLKKAKDELSTLTRQRQQLEQGFSNNLTGANADRHRSSSQSRNRPAKTTGPVKASHAVLTSSVSGSSVSLDPQHEPGSRWRRLVADPSSRPGHSTEEDAPDASPKGNKWSLGSTVYFATAAGGKVRVGRSGERVLAGSPRPAATATGGAPSAASAASSPAVPSPLAAEAEWLAGGQQLKMASPGASSALPGPRYGDGRIDTHGSPPPYAGAAGDEWSWHGPIGPGPMTSPHYKGNRRDHNSVALGSPVPRPSGHAARRPISRGGPSPSAASSTQFPSDAEIAAAMMASPLADRLADDTDGQRVRGVVEPAMSPPAADLDQSIRTAADRYSPIPVPTASHGSSVLCAVGVVQDADDGIDIIEEAVDADVDVDASGHAGSDTGPGSGSEVDFDEIPEEAAIAAGSAAPVALFPNSDTSGIRTLTASPLVWQHGDAAHDINGDNESEGVQRVVDEAEVDDGGDLEFASPPPPPMSMQLARHDSPGRRPAVASRPSSPGPPPPPSSASAPTAYVGDGGEGIADSRGAYRSPAPSYFRLNRATAAVAAGGSGSKPSQRPLHSPQSAAPPNKLIQPLHGTPSARGGDDIQQHNDNSNAAEDDDSFGGSTSTFGLRGLAGRSYFPASTAQKQHASGLAARLHAAMTSHQVANAGTGDMRGSSSSTASAGSHDDAQRVRQGSGYSGTDDSIHDSTVDDTILAHRGHPATGATQMRSSWMPLRVNGVTDLPTQGSTSAHKASALPQLGHSGADYHGSNDGMQPVAHQEHGVVIYEPVVADITRSSMGDESGHHSDAHAHHGVGASGSSSFRSDASDAQGVAQSIRAHHHRPVTPLPGGGGGPNDASILSSSITGGVTRGRALYQEEEVLSPGHGSSLVMAAMANRTLGSPILHQDQQRGSSDVAHGEQSMSRRRRSVPGFLASADIVDHQLLLQPPSAVDRRSYAHATSIMLNNSTAANVSLLMQGQSPSRPPLARPSPGTVVADRQYDSDASYLNTEPGAEYSLASHTAMQLAAGYDQYSSINGSVVSGNIHPILHQGDATGSSALQLSHLASPHRTDRAPTGSVDEAAAHFDIPPLPTGRVLVIEILSTWGDPHYVGMNGIELFTADGRLVSMSEGGDVESITAAPVNDLNGLLTTGDVEAQATAGKRNGSDPRTVDKLLDGCNLTSDAMHMWLAPWTGGLAASNASPGQGLDASFERRSTDAPRASITITMRRPITLAMVRIFNYNRSRIHSYRGVRLLRLRLDDRVIFVGEVRKAPGHVHEGAAGGDGDTRGGTGAGLAGTALSQCSETILFSVDQHIVAAVEAVDPYADRIHGGAVDGASPYIEAASIEKLVRPPTAEAPPPSDAAAAIRPSSMLRRRIKAAKQPGYQPYHAVAGDDAGEASFDVAGLSKALADSIRPNADVGSAPHASPQPDTPQRPRQQQAKPNPIAFDVDSLLAEAEEVVAAGASNNAGTAIRRPIDPDVDLLLREVERSVGTTSKQAPGPSSPGKAAPAPTSQPRTAGRIGMRLPLSSLPRGRLINIRLLSTWGDPHYAGLTGLRVLVARRVTAQEGIIEPFRLLPRHLFAWPRDINIDGHAGDPRTLDKLCDGCDQTTDDTHMWLTVFTPSQSLADVALRGYDQTSRSSHILQVDLGTDHYIAGIVVWNYNKSREDTARGVRHIAMAIDHRPVTLPVPAQVAGGSGSSGYDVITLRQAPGHDQWDYPQYLDLTAVTLVDSSGSATTSGAQLLRGSEAGEDSATALLPSPPLPSARPLVPHQDSEPPVLPCGLELKLIFPSSCGDVHYIGCDAVAIYDAKGRRVPVMQWQVAASPAAVSSDDSAHVDDARVPSNLAFSPPPTTDYHRAFGVTTSSKGGNNECVARQDDPALYLQLRGANSPFPPSRSWLAPLACPHPDIPGRDGNVLCFSFDHPVSISMIRVFNYSKTPARGVGTVEVWLDGIAIFCGDLQPADPGGLPAFMPKSTAAGAAASFTIPRPCNTICFTADPRIIASDVSMKYVRYCGVGEQDVVHWNDGRLVGAMSNKATMALRAAIAAATQARPTTSMPMRPQ